MGIPRHAVATTGRVFPDEPQAQPMLGRHSLPEQSEGLTLLVDALLRVAGAPELARRKRHSPPAVLLLYADQVEREGAPRNTPRNLRAAARRLKRVGLRDGTRAAILRARDQLLAEGLSRTTVQGYLHCASAAWNWAHERSLTPNPWPKIRPLTKRRTQKRPYTLEEGKAVLDYAQEHEPHYAPLLRLLWETGARSGEALAMDGEDVRRDECVVVLRHTKSGEPRTVPVSAECAAALPRARSGRPVWVGLRNGRRLNHSALRAALVRILKALDLDPRELDLHSFRRAWVQDALRAGVALTDGMAALGHQSVKVHVDYQRRAVKDPERLRESTGALRRYRNSLDGDTLEPMQSSDAGCHGHAGSAQALEHLEAATRTFGLDANQSTYLHRARLAVKRAAVRAAGCRGFLLHAQPEVFSHL